VAEELANCFNAVQVYLGFAKGPELLGPEEFVSFIQEKFKQLSAEDSVQPHDVSIIWSRSSDVLPVGKIHVSELRKEAEGYPFGLVIEHAFVQTDEELVFQKRDPTPEGPYEMLSEESALAPYQDRFGFEVTRHRRSTAANLNS
jgi:hypothetical protein